MTAPTPTIELVVEEGKSEEHALDVLSVFSGEDARRAFVDLWLPILGLTPLDEDALTLWNVLSPEYRDTYAGTAAAITTTPDLVRHLASLPGNCRLLSRRVSYLVENFHEAPRRINP